MSNWDDDQNAKLGARRFILRDLEKRWQLEDRIEFDNLTRLRQRFPDSYPPIVDQESIRIKEESRRAEIENLEKIWTEQDTKEAKALERLMRDHPELF